MIFFLVLIGWCLWHILYAPHAPPAPPLGKNKWRFQFKAKGKAPVIIEADSDGKAVRELVRRFKVDPYRDIARMDAVSNHESGR